MSRRPLLQLASEEKLRDIKIEICRVLEYEIATAQRHQREIARRLGTSQANISRVTCRKVDQLTFNQLFRYLAALRPTFRILIAPR